MNEKNDALGSAQCWAPMCAFTTWRPFASTPERLRNASNLIEARCDLFLSQDRGIRGAFRHAGGKTRRHGLPIGNRRRFVSIGIFLSVQRVGLTSRLQGAFFERKARTTLPKVEKYNFAPIVPLNLTGMTSGLLL